MASTQAPRRRPLTGSCHCGSVQYIVFLTLPHQAPPDPSVTNGVQTMYTCNCTMCHKTGVFHVRVPFAPDDFLLLSPSGDPFVEMGDYCPGMLHSFFCKKCAVRCFVFMGHGEDVEVDLGELGVAGHEPGKTTTAWRPKKEGWIEGRLQHVCYLSVNGYTVDAKQDGFDLGEITRSNTVGYFDFLRLDEDDMEGARFGLPHTDGAY